MKVPFLSRRDRHVLKVLRLEPGDVLLFETDAPLTAHEAAELGAKVQAVITEHQVFVVSKLRASVIRPAGTLRGHGFGFRQADDPWPPLPERDPDYAGRKGDT